MGFARRSDNIFGKSRRENACSCRRTTRPLGKVFQQLEDRLPLAAGCGLETPSAASIEPSVAATTSFSTVNDSQSENQDLDFRGWVGWLDRSDLFKFEIESNANVSIRLSELSANLDLTVYNSDLDRIGQSNNRFRWDESLSGTLSSGTYYAKVYPDQRFDMSSYRLTIDTSVIEVPVVPNPVSTPTKEPTNAQRPPSKPVDTGPDTAPSAPDVFPNVAYFGVRTDWGLNAINAPEAWAQGYTGAGVVVAVVDTGIDLDHQDLDANLWTNHSEIIGNGIDDDGNGYIDDIHGWDFSGDDSLPNDVNGHGTHVAGIIAGEFNSTGATGVAYDAQIMPVQVLSRDGSGSLTDVADGIRYAVDNGADIINLSLGSGRGSRILESALAYAEQHDVLIVAAAGNSSGDTPEYPAQYGSSLANVISVGAYSSQDVIAGFSNTVGASGVTQVDAPGVGIFSTYAGNGSATLSGTSMAAPHVAGLAALTLAANPDLTSADLRNLIANGADASIAGSDSIGGVNAAVTVAQAAKYDEASSSTPATVVSSNSPAVTDTVFARVNMAGIRSTIAAWIDADDDQKRQSIHKSTTYATDLASRAGEEQAQAIDQLMAHTLV